MSGHSKWSTIKHKKAIVDSKRGVAFARVAKQICMAVRQGGGGDADKNPSLRVALEAAKNINMPKINVRRAIDKGLGVGGGGETEAVYEGYGPKGVGIMVTAFTNNKNRTGAEVRNILEKSGGRLGSPGSVAYMKKLNPIPMIELGKNEALGAREVIDKLEELAEVSSVWSNLKINN